MFEGTFRIDFFIDKAVVIVRFLFWGGSSMPSANAGIWLLVPLLKVLI